MKNRLRALIALLALLAGVSLVSAPAASASVYECRVTGYSPSTVVLGLSPVAKQYSVSTYCPEGEWVTDWMVDVNRWWGPFAYQGDPVDTIDPQWLYNSDAGRINTATVSADFEGVDWDGWPEWYSDEATYSFVVKRNVTIGSFNASPEPVTKGRAITIKGLVKVADWDRMAYVPLKYASVKVQFKKAGTSTWSTIKTVSTSSYGWVSTTTTARYDGTWRLYYAGSSTRGSRISSTDYVDVR